MFDLPRNSLLAKRYSSKIIISSAALVVFALTLTLESTYAYASDFTQLNDAADDFDDFLEDTYDAFDFSLSPQFRMELTKAKIAREGACVPNDSNIIGKSSEAAKNAGRVIVDPAQCGEPKTVDLEQLEYHASRMVFDTELRIGLYKDLEFRAKLPYVINSTTGTRLSSEFLNSGRASAIYPSDEHIRKEAERVFGGAQSRVDIIKKVPNFLGNRFFDVNRDFKDYKRSGIGDPTFGVHWGIFNDYRDDTKATFNLGLDYTVPIAPIKKFDNNHVGEGLHQINLTVSSSKRFAWLEPYFGLELTGRLFASDSPLRPKNYENNQGQVVKNPAQSGKITLGLEFVPYEKLESSQRYAIDFRTTFAYRSTGREYSILFDQFANSQCRGKRVDDLLPTLDNNGNVTNLNDVHCSWLLQQPGNALLPVYTSDGLKTTDQEFNYDGVVTSPGYATFTASVALNLQPSRYFSLHLFGGVEAQTNHFVSAATPGVAADDGKNNSVDTDNEAAKVERNPVYNNELDASGQRLKVLDYLSWNFGAKISLHF